MIGGKGRSFVLLIMPFHCLVGLECSTLPASATDCIEDECLVLRCERNSDHKVLAQVQRKIALFWRIVIDQQVKSDPCRCERTHKFMRAVSYFLFETGVDIEENAEITAFSKFFLEGESVRHKDNVICINKLIPSSKEPRWLTSSVLGWLGLIKLDELRLSEVTA